ncbi:MAG TPA: hypothetical protein VNR89_15655 [Roseomonas sp.]|nr:hypothetical protein [Roseomonas sp.]
MNQPSTLRSLNSDLDGDIPRAGDDAEQRRLALLAWEMVEIWTIPTPRRRAFTRFSADWLRHKDWRVTVIPSRLRPEDQVRIDGAIQALGHDHWLGTAVDPRIPELTAVWKWGFAEDDMNWFHTSHTGTWVMGFTAERDFAFLGDGDGLSTLAGPTTFLRAALGDLREWWMEFEEDMRIPESERDPSAKAYFDAFIAHYEPFIARA